MNDFGSDSTLSGALDGSVLGGVVTRLASGLTGRAGAAGGFGGAAPVGLSVDGFGCGAPTGPSCQGWEEVTGRDMAGEGQRKKRATRRLQGRVTARCAADGRPAPRTVGRPSEL
jgi:hypothetical protein